MLSFRFPSELDTRGMPDSASVWILGLESIIELPEDVENELVVRLVSDSKSTMGLSDEG